MSPSDAKRHHESLILDEMDVSFIANSSVNPPEKWIYAIYDEWRIKNFGSLRNDCKMLT